MYVQSSPGAPPGEILPVGKITHITHLCSSVSGSTSMFSCRSFTLRNTYESRSGLGTARKTITYSENAQLTESIWEKLLGLTVLSMKDL